MSGGETAVVVEEGNNKDNKTTVNVEYADIRFGDKKLSQHVSTLDKDQLVLYGGRNFFDISEPNGTMFVYKFEEKKMKQIENENIFETIPIRSSGAVEEGVFYTYGGRTETEKTLEGIRKIPVTKDKMIEQKKRNRKRGRGTTRSGTFNEKTYIPIWENVEVGGTWEVPRHREGQAWIQYKGKLYVHSGYDGEKNVQGIWEYTMAKNMWAFMHPKANVQEHIPTPRFGHAMGAGNNKLYIFGGNGEEIAKDMNIYVFNLETKQFEEPIKAKAENYPNGVADHSLSIIGDVLVIIGGSESSENLTKLVENPPTPVKHYMSIYHLKNKEWMEPSIEFPNSIKNKQKKIKGITGHNAHVMGDQLWVVGGDATYLADQDVMVITSNIWKNEDMAKARITYAPADLTQVKRKKEYPPPTPPFDSVIINHKMGVQLNKWYGDLRQKWSLLYRASRDGWTSQNWHQKVDSKGQTITVLKHSSGAIFGGYTPIKWMSTGADKYDDLSWIFSLKNPHDNKSYKFPKIPATVTRQRSVYHASGYGPWFGNNDIIIYSNPHSSTTSNAKLGKAYEYKLSYNPQTFFTGLNNFTLAEIETFVTV